MVPSFSRLLSAERRAVVNLSYLLFTFPHTTELAATLKSLCCFLLLGSADFCFQSILLASPRQLAREFCGFSVCSNSERGLAQSFSLGLDFWTDTMCVPGPGFGFSAERSFVLAAFISP
ncbi:hypothetical protein R1flu_025662 [Riccia fluitans]|uniref:Uncharacterized protein n=1 Tax=Riccia fluitans TaxID=41844 RepID=A0ABD1XYD2_9MARC